MDKMNQSELKCYVNIAQYEHINNKCYFLAFRHYVNISQ